MAGTARRPQRTQGKRQENGVDEMKFTINKKKGYAFLLLRKNKKGEITTNIDIKNVGFHEMCLLKIQLEEVIDKEYEKLKK
jgi:hypothetical protein